MRDAATRLDDIDVEEIDTVTFAFGTWVPEGGSIASAAVTVSVLSGTDATPAALLLGAPQIVGTNVLQTVVGRPAGTDYRLRCRAVVSAQLVRVSAALLKVVAL